MATQHADLTPAEWERFDRDQQLLSIGVEMNRARKNLLARQSASLIGSYERILNLTDLTIQVQTARPLRRELLLWRDLVAALYVTPERSLRDHDDAFRALLTLIPAAYAQLAELLPGRTASSD